MTADTKTKSLPLDLQDLGKPSLVGLSYALRHPDTWPEGFMWDYGDCSDCAMGLAAALWHQIRWPDGDDGGKAAVSAVARGFAMPYEAAQSIFLGGDWTPRRGYLSRVIDFDAVTPEMVADQIDAYLAEAE